VPDEVLVTVARGTPESADEAVARAHGLQLLDRESMQILDRRVVRYRVADGRRLDALITALRNDVRVAEPQPNYYYRYLQDAAQGGGSGLQYALARIDAWRAQTLARGRGTRVAVIDSGIDATHPDLGPAVVESFDAVGGMAALTDPHGTARAGIVAANGILRGVAPEARLLDVRAFAPAGGGAAATTFAVLRGMEWALARRARVLNMSFAGPRDGLLERGIVTASA